MGTPETTPESSLNPGLVLWPLVLSGSGWSGSQTVKSPWITSNTSILTNDEMLCDNGVSSQLTQPTGKKLISQNSVLRMMMKMTNKLHKNNNHIKIQRN